MHERQRRQEFWEREQSTWPHRELSTFLEVGGARWHLQKTGSGPTVLLVHGTGASGHSWRGLLQALSARHCVLVVDLPGHGFSESLPGGRPTLPAMADGLAQLLEAAAFDPEYCVGHSAGVAILCQMALERRIAPRLIIGINAALKPFSGLTALLFGSSAKVLASNSVFAQLLAAQAFKPNNVARVLQGTGSHLDAAAVQLYRRLVSQPLHLAGAIDMMAHWNLLQFWQDLPKLREPITLLVGTGDRAVPPAQAVDIQRRVARVNVVPLPNLGHLAHEEAPELVAQVILSMLDGSTH